MPYPRSGEGAPDYVQKLTAKKRRQWVAIFNSVYAECEADGGDSAVCEARAFKQANGAVLDNQEGVMDEEKDTKNIVIPDVDPVGEVGALTEAKMQTAIEHLRAALAALLGGDDEPAPMPETVPDTPPDEPADTAAELFTESAAPLELVEAETPANRRAPLTLDVGIIRVGPGNKRDNHYYSREMLERDGGVFTGSKMYATDHRNDEKSVRTEVSLVKEILGVRDFDDGAYLTGRVTVFNPDFAEDVRNRADAGVLDSLHCSILAKGEAQPGEVEGAEYNVVTGITEAQSVDWVTRAGAGGHAMAIAENDAEPEQQEQQDVEEIETQEAAPVSIPVTLAEDAEPEPEALVEEVIPSLPLAEVITALGKTNLPAASVAGLASGAYQDLAEVECAVTAEVARLKAAGSGQPLGRPTPPERKLKTQAEIQAELQAVNQKWLR